MDIKEKFRATVARKYTNRCKRLGEEPSLEGLIAYLEEHSLVGEKDTFRYMALELYPMALYNNDGIKRRAIADLEDIIPVSDRTLWGWIGNLKRRHMAYRKGVESNS